MTQFKKKGVLMALTNSTMLPLGTIAPGFKLKNTSGTMTTLDDFRQTKGLVVMFICNHCPYVKHIRSTLAQTAKEYQDKGIRFVAINSNDADHYPDDNYENMIREVATVGYNFPYLLDETQEVAKKYQAACTPDFFLFDGALSLVYRGRFDEASPGNGQPVTGKDLKRAMDQLLKGENIFKDQKPSLGCNIKWRQEKTTT
jgi:thiol-disulfide isomerase/thioredoxin